MRMPDGQRRRGAAALTGAALALAAAGCAAPAAPHRAPAHPTARQVAPLLVQCFADHHLIPASALRNGADSRPPSDSSTWLRAGTVTANDAFGDWFRDNSAVPVQGKTIEDWTHAVEASPATAWPARTCGPVPRWSGRP
jgi:hypothetical protein